MGYLDKPQFGWEQPWDLELHRPIKKATSYSRKANPTFEGFWKEKLSKLNGEELVSVGTFKSAWNRAIAEKVGGLTTNFQQKTGQFSNEIGVNMSKVKETSMSLGGKTFGRFIKGFSLLAAGAILVLDLIQIFSDSSDLNQRYHMFNEAIKNIASNVTTYYDSVIDAA